jgi:hypothetical protein
VDYDLFNPEVHDDPDPWFARLRNECPVHHNTERDFFTLARTEDITARRARLNEASSSPGTGSASRPIAR